jgi:hypothetical protein
LNPWTSTLGAEDPYKQSYWWYTKSLELEKCVQNQKIDLKWNKIYAKEEHTLTTDFWNWLESIQWR